MKSCHRNWRRAKKQPQLDEAQLRQQLSQKAEQFVAATTRAFALLDQSKDQASAKAAAKPLMDCYVQMRNIMREMEELAQQNQFDKLGEKFLDGIEEKMGASLAKGRQSVERISQENCYDCEELSEALRRLCTIEI